ncbi:hypothetical protein BC831DRAFT_472028 [Entophlyctis helioformis]|nr:hypothetical protein BC831DRAFT_472028 [Entophlyctis helioformis]
MRLWRRRKTGLSKRLLKQRAAALAATKAGLAMQKAFPVPLPAVLELALAGRIAAHRAALDQPGGPSSQQQHDNTHTHTPTPVALTLPFELVRAIAHAPVLSQRDRLSLSLVCLAWHVPATEALFDGVGARHCSPDVFCRILLRLRNRWIARSGMFTVPHPSTLACIGRDSDDAHYVGSHVELSKTATRASAAGSGSTSAMSYTSLLARLPSRLASLVIRKNKPLPTTASTAKPPLAGQPANPFDYTYHVSPRMLACPAVYPLKVKIASLSHPHYGSGVNLHFSAASLSYSNLYQVTNAFCSGPVILDLGFVFKAFGGQVRAIHHSSTRMAELEMIAEKCPRLTTIDAVICESFNTGTNLQLLFGGDGGGGNAGGDGAVDQQTTSDADGSDDSDSSSIASIASIAVGNLPDSEMADDEATPKTAAALPLPGADQEELQAGPSTAVQDPTPALALATAHVAETKPTESARSTRPNAIVFRNVQSICLRMPYGLSAMGLPTDMLSPRLRSLKLDRICGTPAQMRTLLASAGTNLLTLRIDEFSVKDHAWFSHLGSLCPNIEDISLTATPLPVFGADAETGWVPPHLQTAKRDRHTTLPLMLASCGRLRRLSLTRFEDPLFLDLMAGGCPRLRSLTLERVVVPAARLLKLLDTIPLTAVKCVDMPAIDAVFLACMSDTRSGTTLTTLTLTVHDDLSLGDVVHHVTNGLKNATLVTVSTHHCSSYDELVRRDRLFWAKWESDRRAESLSSMLSRSTTSAQPRPAPATLSTLLRTLFSRRRRRPRMSDLYMLDDPVPPGIKRVLWTGHGVLDITTSSAS